MKISVITAVFNRVTTIADCLHSNFRQSYRHVERVVIDGASTDGTLAELDSFDGHIDTLISEKDDGIYDALNKGIHLATGDVLGFLHADDVFADDEALSRVADAMSDENVVGVYGDLVYVGRENAARIVRTWRAGNFTQASIRRGWMPPHPTLYVRRSAYAQIGKFDTSFRIAADYDWMLRLMQSGVGRLAYIPQTQVRMRTGGASNASARSIMRKSGEDFRALRRNGFSFPEAATCLVAKNLRKLPQLV